MRTRIKFCGITRMQDVQAAADLGVDAIGLVLTRKSPRFVDIAQARDIRRSLPPFVSAVVLFMNDEPAWIGRAIDAIAPDLVQFHGSESAADCARYGLRYLKAIPMADGADVPGVMAAHPAASGFLLDGHAAGEQGGRAKSFDWSRIPENLRRPVLLAGGLTCDNVGSAIRAARPYAVDVSSGIEAGGIGSSGIGLVPGVKDIDKMRRFVEEVQRACSKS